jgi:hypothetical protein
MVVPLPRQLVSCERRTQARLNCFTMIVWAGRGAIKKLISIARFQAAISEEG